MCVNLSVMKQVFIIVFASAAVFLWTLGFDLLTYDDVVNIYNNSELLKGNWSYFWTHPYMNMYIPVVYTVWAVLYKLFGLSAWAYHLMGFLLHTANAIYCYHIFLKLRFSEKACLIGALIFLVHPIQVESVAWATGLKDTLFFFLSLSSIWFFYFKKTALANQLIGSTFTVLAILTKPTAVVLPVFLGVLFFLSIENFNFTDRIKFFLKKYFLLVILSFFSLYIILISKQQQQSDLLNESLIVNNFERMLIVLDSLGFYISKIVFPTDFYMDYGRIPRYVIENKLYIANSLTAMGFIAGGIYIWWTKFKNSNFKKNENFYFGGLSALLFFLPTSGLASFGYQHISTTADRYMYPVMMSVGLLAAYVFERIEQLGSKKAIYSAIVYLSIFILSVSSLVQSMSWKNIAVMSETFFEGNPRSFIGAESMALLRESQNKPDEAIGFYLLAHELDPTQLRPLAGIVSIHYNKLDYEKLNDFVKTYLSPGQIKKLKTNNLEELFNLCKAIATSYIEQKKLDEAMVYLCTARKVDEKTYGLQIDKIISNLKFESSLQLKSCEDIANH